MEVPPQSGRLDVHHLRTLNANTCNKAAGTLRDRGVSSLNNCQLSIDVRCQLFCFT